MAWYYLEVGIEHLTTGLCIYTNAGCGYQFEMVSPSVFKCWSDQPFNAYWPVKSCHLQAQATDSEPAIKNNEAVANFAANVAAQALRDAWVLKDTEGNFLPAPVADALIRKFGSMPIPPINRGWPYYWFNYAGMFHGIEPDGYIHT